MKQSKPRLALVTLGIRRDLLAPLQYITRFKLQHFYRDRTYGDLEPSDINESLNQFRSPLDLYKQLVAAQPAVVQTVEPFSFYTQPYLWASSFAARRTGALLIVPAFENRPLDIKFGKVRGVLLRQLLSRYFKSVSRVIVLNDGAKKNALACSIEPTQIRRALWGVWGVDTQEFFPRAELQNDARIILFAGRLHREKGIFVLLDAFARVQHQSPTARLVIAGDGPAHDAILSYIQSNGLQNITLLGMVKHREMPRIFQQATIVSVPSLTTRKWAEQVGSTLLQAMACGVPIVATRSGAIPEFVPDRQAGFLVPENDAHALADALSFLLEHPEYARALGNYGRELAVRKYDARTNVHRAEDILLEALQENKL